jgi:hypothetical protein
MYGDLGVGFLLFYQHYCSGHPGNFLANPPISRGSWLPKIVFYARHLPGLVNIQKAIENGHRNSGFTH